MGDKWFGMDVDNILAYHTPYEVRIHDRMLGLTKYSMVFMIFVYIFVFNIWYKGVHFKMMEVHGVARMQWQEPTQKCNPYKLQCNGSYRDASELPYCTQYAGTKPAVLQRECSYFDARDLPENMLNGVFLPTFIAKYRQERTCEPGAESCDTVWRYIDKHGRRQHGKGYASPSERYYVADVEDFTLLVDHVFSTANGELQQDDYQMQGFYLKRGEGEYPRPIKCLHKHCKGMGMNTNGGAASFLGSPLPRLHKRGRRGFDQEELQADPEETISLAATEQARYSDEVVAIEDGDVLSLGKIFDLAGASLDAEMQRRKGDTIRHRGVALVIDIHYENLVRWRLLRPFNPWYTISVRAMPADTFKNTVAELSEDERIRSMAVAYGTMITVIQSGNLAQFDPIFALTTLTSAMALLAVATTLTEMLMLYILPRKSEYQKLKYKESRDFLTTSMIFDPEHSVHERALPEPDASKDSVGSADQGEKRQGGGCSAQ